MEVRETIRIRKFGYPVRLKFKTFLDRYQMLSPLTNFDPTPESCTRILDMYNISGKVGKTKIFLQLKEAERVSNELKEFLSKVVKIQKMVRGHLARVDYGFLRTNRKQEERSAGNLLVSISSRST